MRRKVNKFMFYRKATYDELSSDLQLSQKNTSIKALSLWLFVRNSWQRFGESFHLNIRKKFFTVRTIVHWNNLPRDTVKSPSLEVFEMQLDRVLDNLI
ncbi:hypothetical protein QYF61_020734 [Mycteria americana]|uniref:Uncharacterized protein n=1 Tax=Mycteria americana TaxID=33587 RepID=A0AAN7NUY5_MYCAM|nr:hypothetical protein QYF61_020734 [Mycteria americana]